MAQAKATQLAASLAVGDEIRVALDDNGDAAVFHDKRLVGWPAKYRARLKDCLERGYKYQGRVVERRGTAQAPYMEVSVEGRP